MQQEKCVLLRHLLHLHHQQSIRRPVADTHTPALYFLTTLSMTTLY